MALLLGAMIIHGIQPGPQMMTERPDIFWSLIASFWVGNLMLLILNIPLIGIWVRLLSIPYRFVFPAVLLFICIGVYSINNNLFDVASVLLFGLCGFVFVRLGFEPAPLLLGFVLGPLMEENFRRALLLSRGDMTIFLQRPISAVLVVASALLVAGVVISHVRKRATVPPVAAKPQP
jgi:TctA family transporter